MDARPENITSKNMDDHALQNQKSDDHDLLGQQRHPHSYSSTPLARTSTGLVRIVREYEFFDDQQKPVRIHYPSVSENRSWPSQEILFPGVVEPRMPSSSKERVSPLQEISLHDHDDRHRGIIKPATSSSAFCNASTTDDQEGKRRCRDDGGNKNSKKMRLFRVEIEAKSDDDGNGNSPTFLNVGHSLEGDASSGYNEKTVRLFGVDLLASNHDDDWEKRLLKDKDKILEIGYQESQVDESQVAERQRQEIDGRRVIINPEGEEKKKKKCSRKPKPPNFSTQVLPLFHPSILEEVGGGQEPPTLMFEKVLKGSDIKKDQNRLFIPQSEKLMDFLTEEERSKVEGKSNLKVLTRDPLGNEYQIHLSFWQLRNNPMIILKHGWYKLVTTNNLQKGDSVQGWGYRIGNEFRLAIHVIRKQ